MNVTQFLDARESWEAQIPGYSYKLAPSQYALDSFASDKFYVDEAKMAVYIPFASGERRDGVGDLLEIGGIETDRHRVNPIVLFDHGKQIALPIAVAEDPETKNYTVELDTMSKIGGALCYFYGAKSLNQDQGAKTPAYEHLLFCEQIFDMMAKRFIRGGSIGYTVIHANELPPDYRTGTPAGLHLIRVKMLEVSAVILPANQDTVSKGFDGWVTARKDMARRILSMPKICGKSPSSYLVKSLLPIAGQKRVTLYTGHSQQKSEEAPKPQPSHGVYSDPKTSYALSRKPRLPKAGDDVNTGSITGRQRGIVSAEVPPINEENIPAVWVELPSGSRRERYWDELDYNNPPDEIHQPQQKSEDPPKPSGGFYVDPKTSQGSSRKPRSPQVGDQVSTRGSGGYRRGAVSEVVPGEPAMVDVRDSETGRTRGRYWDELDYNDPPDEMHQPQKNYVGGIGGNKFPVYEDPETGRPQGLNTESNRAMGANVAEPWHGRPQGLASRNDDNSDQELREWGERIRQQKANFSRPAGYVQRYDENEVLESEGEETWPVYEHPEDTYVTRAGHRTGVPVYKDPKDPDDRPADITPEDEAAINAMASDVELDDKAMRRPQIGERVTYAGPGARPSEPMGEVLHTDSTGRTTVHWEDGTLPQQYDLEHLKSPAGESYSAEEKAVHPQTGIDPEDPNSYRTPPEGGQVHYQSPHRTLQPGERGTRYRAGGTNRNPATGSGHTMLYLPDDDEFDPGMEWVEADTNRLTDPEGEPYKSIQPTRKALKPPRLPSRNVETKSTDDTPKPVKLDTSHSVDPGIDPEEANRLNAVRGRPKPGTRVRANYAGQGEPREGTVTHLDDSHYTYPVEVSHQGDEGEIVRYYEPDEVTDMEGRPYKSIAGKDVKSAAPELHKPHYKNPLSNSNVPPARFKPGAGAIKSMDPNAMNPKNMPVDSPTEEMNDNPEPYGAQVLRRLHEDGSRLLADYDSLLYHLEHEPTRQHLMQTCAAIEDGLSVVEKMWRKEKRYKELPPLIKSEEELDQEIPEEELMGEVPEDDLPPEQMQDGLPEEQLGDEEWDQPMAEEELASPEDEYYGEEMPGMGMDPGMEPSMEDMNGDGMPDINSEDIQGDMDTIDDHAVPANSGAELPPPTPEEAWEASQRPQDDAWSQQEREFVARGSGKAIKTTSLEDQEPLYSSYEVVDKRRLKNPGPRPIYADKVDAELLQANKPARGTGNPASEADIYEVHPATGQRLRLNAEIPVTVEEAKRQAKYRAEQDRARGHATEVTYHEGAPTKRHQKSLRVKYKAIGMLLKGMCPACGAAGCKCYMKGLLPAEQKSDYSKVHRGIRRDAAGRRRPYKETVRAVEAGSSEDMEPGHQEELDRERQEWQQEFGRNPTNMPQRKSDPTQPGPRINEMGEIERAGNIPQVKPPTDQQKKPEQKVGQQNTTKAMNADQIQQQLDMFDWDDQDRSTLMEISSFVDELGQEGSIFDEETRMKAYHYHKTMEKLMASKSNRNVNESLPYRSDDPQYDRLPPENQRLADKSRDRFHKETERMMYDIFGEGVDYHQPEEDDKAFEMEDEGYKNLRRNNGS